MGLRIKNVEFRFFCCLLQRKNPLFILKRESFFATFNNLHIHNLTSYFIYSRFSFSFFWAARCCSFCLACYCSFTLHSGSTRGIYLLLRLFALKAGRSSPHRSIRAKRRWWEQEALTFLPSHSPCSVLVQFFNVKIPSDGKLLLLMLLV